MRLVLCPLFSKPILLQKHRGASELDAVALLDSINEFVSFKSLQFSVFSGKSKSASCAGPM